MSSQLVTYTKEQLVKALQEQQVHLEQDDYEPDDELYTSPEEHLEWLEELTYEELIEETSTDDVSTLQEFMSNY